MGAMIFSMKMILITAGVLSVAMGLKLSIPIAANGGPALWSIILSWMKPPYLYIIINGIIITIAATSRFHQSHTESPAVRSDHLISVKTPPPAIFELLSIPAHVHSTPVPEPEPEPEPEPGPAAEVVVSEVEHRVADLKPVMVNDSKVDLATEADDLLRPEAKDVFDKSTLPYNQSLHETLSPEVQFESLFPAREKPLASSRFVHRKPNRIAPEGAKALRRVARPKKQETLESTWKMITEGRHVPLNRHLKKSDTCEHHAPPSAAVDHHAVPKSVTFKDRTNYEPPELAAAVARIRKEPSLGQDELNRKVEAFINKFNEDMRMQRQESLNQYKEMINRGV